jgi:hypothetical protein
MPPTPGKRLHRRLARLFGAVRGCADPPRTLAPDPPCHRLAGEVQGEREFVGGGRSAPEKIPAMPSVMPVGQFIRSLTYKFFGTAGSGYSAVNDPVRS